ncbi:MAG: ABC transporter permease [Nanoarchaeota archaeon]|nr:ABC transporter permease [Nanoarchaeota archaeon]MBU1445236.1 ABC transporter permease [Nanoarchaeota archaeon]MBU2420392.1 ABC transporter permease [Nanoarchaeota archaeon]MBU2475170.1 ABC transporter permease [Nanoarchaeota archaeon]
MKGFTRALKLELENMKERKFSLLFYLIAPLLIIALFYMITSSLTLDWTNYASMGLRIYDFYVPNILGIVVLFITTQLMVLRIIGERAPYGTLDRELIAISKSGMFFGKLIANLIFVFLQCFLIFLSAYVFFPAKNYGSPISVFLFILLIGIFGAVLGFFISIMSKNKEQAVQLVPFFVLILMVLSGILIPIDLMPTDIATITSIFPLTLGTTSLKTLTLDGVGFEDVFGNMLFLIFWIVGLTFISLLKFKLERK